MSKLAATAAVAAALLSGTAAAQPVKPTKRAGSRRTVMVAGASHVVMVSQPEVVADLIEEAAQ